MIIQQNLQCVPQDFDPEINLNYRHFNESNWCCWIFTYECGFLFRNKMTC